MPLNNAAAYIDYFRKMAQYHPSILHDPASELADSEAGLKKFCRWSAEEVVTGLRTKVGYPLLLIEMYDVETASQIVYDIKSKPRGAFTVLDTVKSHDYNDEERAYTVTENIVADILKKIWDQHYGQEVDRCATVFKDVDFNGISITPVGPLFNNEFGWRVEFAFSFRHAIDPTAWVSGADPFLTDADWETGTW